MHIETIMMVDDDPCIRKVAQMSLSRVGKWAVVLADSGTKALELMTQTKPDVILLDVMMPGMDGPTTFKKLKESADITHTPVIFMTAKVLKQELESYCQLGAAGVITKPFDPMTLPHEIRNIVDCVH